MVYYKILSLLVDKQVYFCFQTHRINKYYNLSVDDQHGNRHNISTDTLADLEKTLNHLWGHLDGNTPAQIPIIPKPSGMPLPPGMM